MRPRVLLVVPTATYRAGAFLGAAGRLGLDVAIASDSPTGLPGAGSQLVLDLDRPWSAPQAELDSLGRVDAVVGLDEAAVLAAAELARRLDLPGNPLGAARAARNKAQLRHLLTATGLPQPRWAVWHPAEPAPQVAPPCIVKPTDGSASFGVVRADSAAELEAAGDLVRGLLARRGDPEPCDLLVESFVPGPEVAVEGLVASGVLTPLVVYDKPLAPDGPYFEESVYLLPSQLPGEELEAIFEVLAAAVEAVGLRQGAVHAEFRLGSGSPTLIDLAARSIGGRCSGAVRFESGRSLEELILLNALGLDPPTTSLDPEPSGVLMLSAPTTGRLAGVRGRRRALAQPGVVGVELTAVPGTLVQAPPAADRYLGFVFARGPRPEAVLSSLLGARDQLEFEIDP